MWEWEPWNSLGAYTDATMDFIFTFVVMELFGGTVSMEPQMRIFRGGGGHFWCITHPKEMHKKLFVWFSHAFGLNWCV